MTMTAKDAAMCAVFAMALPLGQAMFKGAALYHAKLQGGFVVRLVQNWPLMGAFAWYGMTAILWFYILTRTPLSFAYAFSLLGSGLVPLIGWLIFKEPVGWRFAAGYMLMLAGLAMVIHDQARV